MTTLEEWNRNRKREAELALLGAASEGRLAEVQTLIAGGTCLECTDEFEYAGTGARSEAIIAASCSARMQYHAIDESSVRGPLRHRRRALFTRCQCRRDEQKRVRRLLLTPPPCAKIQGPTARQPWG